jgi:hypothetical protein
VSTDVSEEHIASIFRVEETIVKAGGKQSSGLHGFISQKMVLFITTAVRTSNPIQQVLHLVPRSRMVELYRHSPICLHGNVLH